MRSSNSETSGKSSSFWGIVLSLFLHGIVLILALFWGFGTPTQPGEPQSIQGRLVSLSELEQEEGRKLEPAQPQINEPPLEPNQEEVKREETTKIETEKPKEKEIEVSRPEKKEQKKEEPKKVEIKKEEPKKKNEIALDSKEKEKEKPKEKQQEEKKQVVKKPETTEPQKPPKQKEPEKKKEASFEDIRRGVLEDMEKAVTDKRRRNVIEDIEKNVGKEKQVAEANSPDSKDTNPNYRPGGQTSGAKGGAVIGLFIQRIREEISSNWKIPQTIPTEGDLRTEVLFRMDENGRVYDVRVENPSGNPAFDDFCVKAIYKAAPLTPPPPELLEVAKTEGVKVSFEP